MGNDSPAFSQMSPREQALYIRDVLIPEGEAYADASEEPQRKNNARSDTPVY